MDEFFEPVFWLVIVLGFAVGYFIVSFIANKMKTDHLRIAEGGNGTAEGTHERDNSTEQDSYEDFRDRDKGTSYGKSNCSQSEEKICADFSLALLVVPSEIKAAYRGSLKRYHPDRVEHLGDEFKEIAAIKTNK
jgi:hypothetical protein